MLHLREFVMDQVHVLEFDTNAKKNNFCWISHLIVDELLNG